ncbi:hypothetical protein [Listeria fleischmannii]|uniref:hypothetical protein n=1 Tax=Listeria fleischmannii TaxID=1069827 RepID=UPI00162808A5|nr:hypothetical protein [Listeria fleischmannii]MBC1420049.1 hypothetical protein [Listeria fleischmannii]
MERFQIGDRVQIEEGVMRQSIGTIVYYVEHEQKYVVRIGQDQDLFYLPEQLSLCHKEDGFTHF